MVTRWAFLNSSRFLTFHNVPDDGGRAPYIFNVEFQIYTLEGFLRTVHSRHEASHERMKLRQFLEGLLPYLFPPRIYGDDALAACLAGQVEAP